MAPTIQRAVTSYESALNIKSGTMLIDSCELPIQPTTFGSIIEEIISSVSMSDEKKAEVENYVIEMTQRTIDFLFPRNK